MTHLDEPSASIRTHGDPRQTLSIPALRACSYQGAGNFGQERHDACKTLIRRTAYSTAVSSSQLKGQEHDQPEDMVLGPSLSRSLHRGSSRP
jgi:hypothetical protein